MEHLPPELVTKILSLLDPSSVVQCRQVCRRWKLLSERFTHPLYVPRVVGLVMRNYKKGRLYNILRMREVCRLWKEGLDKLTWRKVLFLKGVTSVSSRSPGDLSDRSCNPFPTRIVQMKLCHEHDNPDNAANSVDNENEILFMQWFGEHIHYLQVALQHSHCAELHFANMTNFLKHIHGLVLSECVSPYRFHVGVNETTYTASTSETPSEPNYEILENLKFLKIEHQDCEARYAELYKKILGNSPNVEHLEFNGNYHLDMGIMRLLTNQQYTLTRLKIDAAYPNTEETLEILSKSYFPLIYLSLQINGFEDELVCHKCTMLLHSKLEALGATLQRLELKLSWFENGKRLPEILTEFPSSKFLTNLERLKLVGFRGKLNFLRDFTSLKALMIVYYNPDEQEIFTSAESFHKVLPNLRETYLPVQNSCHYDSPEIQEKMRNFMYAGDKTFVPKYTGLYMEAFP